MSDKCAAGQISSLQAGQSPCPAASLAVQGGWACRAVLLHLLLPGICREQQEQNVLLLSKRVGAANLAVPQTKGLTLFSLALPRGVTGSPAGRVGCDQEVSPELVPQLISVFLLVVRTAQLYSPNTNSWKEGSC